MAVMVAEREASLRREAEHRAEQRVFQATMGVEEAKRRADWRAAYQALTAKAEATGDRFEHERLSALAGELDAAWRSGLIGP